MQQSVARGGSLPSRSTCLSSEVTAQCKLGLQHRIKNKIPLLTYLLHEWSQFRHWEPSDFWPSSHLRLSTGTRWPWPSGTVPDFAIARSRVRLPPVAAVYQRQFSVPSLRGQLMSTSERWGVNGHTTRWVIWAPYPWSCSFGWCLAEGYRKRRSAPPYGPLRLGKGLYFTFTPVISSGRCENRKHAPFRRYKVRKNRPTQICRIRQRRSTWELRSQTVVL